jgi:hypothetical protein
MGNDTGKSWVREIIVGITVAVGAGLILAWLGLGKNDSNSQPVNVDRNPQPVNVDRNPQPVVVIPPAPTESPDRTEVQSIDLSGTWMEPGGNVVQITQNGNRVTFRMPYLEAIMGMDTTQNGIVEASPDRRYLAYINASNGMTSAQFYLTQGGNRLEGWVSNGFTRSPAILIRSE